MKNTPKRINSRDKRRRKGAANLRKRVGKLEANDG